MDESTPRGTGVAGPQSQHPQSEDPLAELARLIGQEDPFAGYGRDTAHGTARVTSSQRDYNQPHGHQDFEEPAPAPQWLARAPTQRERFQDEPGPYAQPYDYQNTDPRYEESAAAYDPRYGEGATDPYAANYADDPAYDPYYNEDGQMPPHSDDVYADQRTRRRQTIIAAVGVVGVVALGTLAAYGYRVYTIKEPSAPPPVIKAEATPTKTTPPASADSGDRKLIYDRVGEKPQGERIVSREEQPVNVTAAPPPRVVMPPMTNAPAPTTSAPAVTTTPAPVPAAPTAPVSVQAPQPTPSAVNEPKKVRTVTIRPDQPAGTARAQVTNTNALPPPPASPSASPSTPPSQPARATTAQPAVSNAPLSIAPQAPGAPTAVPRAPAATPSPVMRTAAVPPQVPAGSYVVQVTSQRNEGEAQAAYRALQAKYPTVLGSREPIIRRADLGDKGIYFRAQVGPFSTADQAQQLCSNLKAAGGQCIVQRN